jgi:EmrB/QacA subfamily drug resistance transporter
MKTVVTGKNRQLGILISACFAGFMILLDGNIVNIALPYIGKSFNAGTSLIVQIMLFYLLVISGGMIIMGKLADKAGTKRIFVSGFIVFTCGSLLCGISPALWFLLLSRAIQAVGSAMLIVTAITIVPKFIPPERRGWAFGILAPVNSIGVMIGAPLGGLITGYLNWHWIFLINVPAGAIAVLVALKVIPDDIKREKVGKILSGFDYPGAVLSFMGLGLLVYFLNQGKSIGWDSPITVGGLILALLLLVIFCFIEKKKSDPLLDMSIFANRDFSLAIIASFLAYGLMTGSNVLMPFYLKYILHIRVELSGFIMVIFTVIFSLLSPLSGRLSDQVPKTRLTSLGMMIAAAACLFFIFFIPRMDLVFVIVYLVIAGISFALFVTPNNNLVMTLTQGTRQTVSTGIFKVFTTLASLFGVLIMEFMFTLCLPPSAEPTLAQLHKASQETLLTGFRYSYLGGFILAFLAMVTILFIRARRSGN